MLTDGDIAFMYDNRAEITAKRKRLVQLVYFDGTKDPFTGELLEPVEVSLPVEAVVTENMGMGTEDRFLDGAPIYEKGNVQISVDIGLVPAETISKITEVRHDSVRYEVLSVGLKGIGRRNRYELNTRKVS